MGACATKEETDEETVERRNELRRLAAEEAKRLDSERIAVVVKSLDGFADEVNAAADGLRAPSPPDRPHR